MKNLILNKKPKATLFQVLLLDNNASDDVEVQEAKRVDFFQVKEHLRNGGSVFITSKESQKMALPRSKAQVNYSKSRKICSALLQQHLRSS